MEKVAEFINGEESIRALIATRQAATGTLKKESPKVNLLPKKGLFSRKGEKGKQAAPLELSLTPLNGSQVDVL
jgi:hypothetical protein